MARRMSCGACGNSLFKLEGDDANFPTILILECTQCGSRTIYQAEVPRMKQSWGEHSEGVTCFLGKEDE